jgi:hypothetical protein
MQTQSAQRIPCRDITCYKTFSDRAGERKHCRNKHPGLIGSSGIALNPQVTVHVASPIEEDPNYQLQPNDEEPGFGFDSNNEDMAVYNVFPLHYEEVLPPQLPAITQHDVRLLQHLDDNDDINGFVNFPQLDVSY